MQLAKLDWGGLSRNWLKDRDEPGPHARRMGHRKPSWKTFAIADSSLACSGRKARGSARQTLPIRGGQGLTKVLVNEYRSPSALLPGWGSLIPMDRNSSCTLLLT